MKSIGVVIEGDILPNSKQVQSYDDSWDSESSESSCDRYVYTYTIKINFVVVNDCCMVQEATASETNSTIIVPTYLT